MPLHLEIQLHDPQFLAGLLVAPTLAVTPTPPPLSQLIDHALQAHSDTEVPPKIRQAVRDLLRRGGFRPSGRNKPASEYLAQAAREGRFPRINNCVDIINLLSLQSGLPISLLDLNAFDATARIRYGQPGETYVFNSAGQAIDLNGLICVCSVADNADRPLGSPIKDSMAGKIRDLTTSTLAVIYASTAVIDPTGMDSLLSRFAQLLQDYANASSINTQVVITRPETP